MILYDLIILLALPWIHKKKHHYKRLFAPIPNPDNRPVIWIHAVSVGEVKAARPLFTSLLATYPSFFFLITTTTEAGYHEAHRFLPQASAITLLPIDLRCIVTKWVSTLRPTLFILIETDFWPNLLSAIKKRGGKNILVSGKLSKKSARRFRLCAPLSCKLFSLFDLVCAQNAEHFERFRPFIAPPLLHQTGNLKLDHQKEPIDIPAWRQRLNLPDPTITISCTHAPEEERLLDLLPLDSAFFILAPRHPDRFNEVAAILNKKAIPFYRWTLPHTRTGKEKILLVDAMGQLPICYALSRLAIVCGSFTDRVGGHNVLEPCLYGTPVFFGPHTHTQKEFVARALQAHAGLEVSYATIRQSIQNFLQNPHLERTMRAATAHLFPQHNTATTQTLTLIKSLLSPQEK